MVKQLHHDAGARDGIRYTLFHASRETGELAFADELRAIEVEARIDFLYVPSVSRPAADQAAELGRGRANNLLRHVLGMPLKEDEDLEAAEGSGADVAAARLARERTVRPELPGHVDREHLRRRLTSTDTVVLSCGNPASMEDVHRVATVHEMRFEKEDWKLVPSHN
jgi:NAD(P)H-flavin reductase